MSTHKAHILISELNSSFAYLKRLVQVTIKMRPNIQSLAKTKKLLLDTINELLVEFKGSLGMDSAMAGLEDLDLLELELILKQTKKFLKYSLELRMNSEATYPLAIRYINRLFETCHELHQHSDPFDQMSIQLPRMTVIKIANKHEEVPGIHFVPKFFLELDLDAPEEVTAKLFSLEQKRKLEHERLLKVGHDYIAQKNFNKALESFLEANSLVQTAQSLTLIGWAYSLMGDLGKAKEYCFEAIKQDPDYGNPYNDIGSYLLSEGKIKESFSWFQLAKKAKYYLNREFPYINSAKAYLMMKNYREALMEFKVALELVPYHKDLQKTVNRLKNLVYKKNLDLEERPEL